jgi:hypothetical protein
MYRVLAVIMMAYAICYPRIASEAKANLEAFSPPPTRAERLVADFQTWLERPIGLILAALNKEPPG